MKVTPFLIFFGILIVLALDVAAMLVSLNAYTKMNSLNFEMLKYSVDNKCSDAVLQYSLEQFYLEGV
jgi:hypothetical protein